MGTNKRAFPRLVGVIAVIFIVGAALFGALPTIRSAPDAKTGELIIGLRADPESLDPYFVYHPSGFAVMEALFDSLVMTDEHGAIVPHLASHWEIVDDTTIEFTLRHGVSFHDGTPFDARAVQHSIERVLDAELQSGLRSDFEAIERVEIVSPDRVRLHLLRTDSSILWRLTELAMVAPGAEAGSAEASSATDPIGPIDPVGTGPFRFVSRVRDSHVIVEANPDYFTTGAKPGPGVERIVFRIIPEDATRVAELRTGGVHLIEHVPIDMAPLVTRAGMGTVPVNTGRFFVAWFVADKGGPLADVRVRRALNFGIDTQAIVDSMWQGYATPIASPFTPGTLGFDETIKPYEYDPAHARRLLADAGYPDGFSLTIDTTGNRSVEAQLVSGLLRDIGINASVRPLEASIFNTNWTTGETGDLIVASWGASGDPQRYLDMLIKSDGFLSRYDNAALDALLDESRSTLDPEKRHALLSEIQRTLRDDPAALYLWSAVDIYGVSPAVHNWRPRPTERLIVSGIGLTKGTSKTGPNE